MKLPRFARARAQRLVQSPRELLRVIEQAWRKQASARKARSLGPVLAELRTMLDLLQAWARGEYPGVSNANLVTIVGAVAYSSCRPTSCRTSFWDSDSRTTPRRSPGSSAPSGMS